MTLTPAILFTFVSTGGERRTWSRGWLGGVGASSANLALLAGYQVTYNRNVSLALGALLHKERRLLGKYAVGQTVEADLSNEQLTSERYYPNAFVGLSFRFKDNPFGGEGGSGKPTPGAKKAVDQMSR